MLVLYPLSAFLLCLALTPLVRGIARKRGWIANPTADRWHEKPTALMGGIAIFAGLALPLLFLSRFSPSSLLLPVTGQLELQPTYASVYFAGSVMFLGAGLCFILGLVDDFLHIKPQTKLLGQIMAASLVAYYGFRLHWFQSLTLDTMVTIVWIVGITNALNLLDNMDGLCAGVGMVAALSLGLILYPVHPHIAWYAFVLSGTLAGFLVFNFKPATIFMGDCGSLTIGFCLAFLSICYSGYTEPGMGKLAAFAVPILALMVPIFDTTLVTVIRLLSGRKASVGGRDHTSHRLVLIGMSEKRAVLFLYGITAMSGLAAHFVANNDTLASPIVLVPAAVSFLLMGIYLAQLRIYPEKEFSVLRDQPFTPILLELTYKRQLLLVMLDFLLIAFSYYFSYRLRFSGQEFELFFQVFLRSLPAVIACKLAAYFIMGVYRGIWSFLSFNDVYVYIKSSLLGTLLCVVVVTFIYRFENFSKAIFVIDWFLATGLLLLSRGSFRIFLDTLQRRTLAGENVIICGAGRGGEILLREMLNNPRIGMKPVGFVDDDPLKAGKRLQGFPVLGTSTNLDQLCDKYGIRGLVVSFSQADPARTREFKLFCENRGLFLKRFVIDLEDI